ncbi:MAG: TatD family hydrolase [Bergeyella sp.]
MKYCKNSASFHSKSVFLIMLLFDFHHHHPKPFGIYNPEIHESPTNFPFSAGIHPKDIDENIELYFEKLKKDSRSEFCTAVGECGLDSFVSADEKIQEDVFQRQIFWANEIRKPVIIHCVRKFEKLPKFIKTAEVPMIIHGFNKKKTIAEEMLKHGFYLSFGKATLRNVSLQQIVKDFPLEKMFLETDDDDFEIIELYRKTSELKGISVENLHEQILKNFETITKI